MAKLWTQLSGVYSDCFNAHGNVLIPLLNSHQSNTSREGGLELGRVKLFDEKVMVPEPSTCAQVTTLQQSNQELTQAESTESTHCQKGTQ